jgi:CheY-like chemotaxis protein
VSLVRADGRAPTILIVDDSPMMRTMIRSVLADLGPRIIECADGAEACRLYTEHQPDWVLMDVAMRPMEGLPATRAIVRRFPDARVVIVTQHDDAATRARAFEAGACAFIAKEDLRPLRSLIAGTGSPNPAARNG